MTRSLSRNRRSLLWAIGLVCVAGAQDAGTSAEPRYRKFVNICAIALPSENGPIGSFDLAAQQPAAGSHSITAKAYDNAGMELVRYVTGTKLGRMSSARAQQSVEWKVTVS